MPKARRKNLIPLPEGVEVGKNVRYYLNGWRYGRLDKIEGNNAGIHVNAAYSGVEKRLKWISVADIKKVDE